MNRCIALLLVILLLLPPVSKMLYVVDYSLNKAYIISTYCINQNKPQLACEGKCHLTKQLAKSEHSEKAHVLKEKIENLYFIGSSFCFFSSPAKILTDIMVVYHASHTFFVAADIFHPPQVGKIYMI